MRRILVAVALTLGLVFGVSSPVLAWGDSSPCGSSYSGTTRWSAFAGHYQDVYERICDRYDHLRYARKPIIDYPTRNIVFGPAEDLNVISGPYVSDVYRDRAGKVYGVTWKWSTKQCVLKVGCQTFKFKLKVRRSYRQQCYASPAKPCHARHYWW